MASACRVLTLAALAVVLVAVPAYAQTGRIRGTVRDAGGGPVSGVTVRAQGAAATRRATTTTDGSYSIQNLEPGAYTVSASLPGLRTQMQQAVQVGAGAEAVVDFVMQAVELEAVTVTATLREQELAKVPFSIAAPTEQALRLRGAENIEAVAANVAGFSIQNLGPGQSTVAMRGVSSGQIARDQPGVKEEVASYLDDAPISLSLFTPDIDLFDVSRVEVLRGPQGTLFGSGSLAGTVRYISAQPELGATRTFGEVGISQVRGGVAGNNAKLGFNVPLGDKSAFRVVGYSNELPGWMDAVQPNFQVNRDVNGGNRTGARVAFRYEPNNRFSLTPRFIYQKVRMDGWNRIDDFNILANPYTTTRPAVTLGERQLFTQQAEPFTDEFLLGDVNLQLAVGSGMTLTSVTSFTNRYILVVRDATALTSSITGGSIGLPEEIYTIDSPLDDATKSKVWTQEVRLAGGEGRVQWLVGGFYSNNKRHYGQDLDVTGFEDAAAALGVTIPTTGLKAPKDHLFWSDLDYKLTQVAAFGEATVTAGKFDLTGGLRYYDFDEDREQIFDGIFGNNFTGDSLVSQPGSAKASGVAPRFIVSYRVSEAVTLNAQAAQGFRLGGINDPLNYPACTAQDSITFSGNDSWTDEKAWNYEVGAKSRILGGRGSLNVSAFYMDIQDLQLTVTAGSCSSRLILNAPKSRSQGLEVEFTASPNANLDIAVSASYADGELQSSLLDGTGTPLPGIVSGNRLPAVPKTQGTASLTYGWPLNGGGRAFVSGSYQYVGSRYTLIDDQGNGVCLNSATTCPAGTVDMSKFEVDQGGATIGGPLTQTIFTFDPLLPAYNLANLRVGLTRSSWEAAFYIKNLTDERAFLALDRERGTRARVGYLTNQPRTYGLTFRFNY
ncbi:MAG TPA: TonB-dependent receptor [Gemmatimonadales bacterium]|nr:TonB-dependent receptor [Gemmatimonadales bacterium]